jgi:hypothetical protein
MTNQILIEAADAVSIASLAAAAVTGSDTKLTPQLAEIRILLEAGELNAAATDRYTAATYKTTATGPDTEFRLTPAAAKFLIANVKRINKHYEVPAVSFTIDQEARLVTITHGGATFSDTWSAARFPAIGGLVEGWKATPDAQPVKLRSDLLARLNKFLDSFTRVEWWILELGENRNSYPMPGPVMATAGKFRVLMQPNTYSANN